MNKHFPYWKNADEILLKEIVPLIGVYTKPDPLRKSLNVAFLPFRAWCYVPHDYFHTFTYRVNDFIKWAYSALKLDALFQRFICHAMTDAVISEIEASIQERIKIYNAMSNIPFDKKFLEFMGVPYGPYNTCQNIFEEEGTDNVNEKVID